MPSLCAASLAAVAFAVASVSFADAQLALNLDEKTGAYTIQNGGVDWLYGGPYGVRNNNKVLSSSDGTLTIKRVDHDHSASFMGEYRSTAITWQDASGSPVFATTFNVYTATNIIHFEQEFVPGLKDAASGDNNDVISAFPTFNESQSTKGLLNHLTYKGTFCGGSMGGWGDGSFSAGHQSGPLVLYNKSMNTVVVSAMDHFMTNIPARSKSFGGAIAYGIIGKINSLPQGFVTSTIMVADKGIKNTMARWGNILLQQGKKFPSTLQSDLSVQYLGYYTDNGAYYYYRTEPGKNYQQTMLDVKAQAAKLDLPFHYFQFDSWWYYKDHHSAVTLWEPRPDVFPDGMTQWLGMPLVLHNRWWSPNNNYSHEWFIAEEDCALPASEDIFDYIMTKAKKWGMIVYEQDWLVTTYERMKVTQETLYDAENWLKYMGAAAAKLNITVQYCMPLPMHMLQSTTIQPVNHARASGDYHPGNQNWNVGLTSLFYWSIGIIPFKDDFFTYNGNETGCPYGSRGCSEPNYQLVTLVAVLTGGPVGPSDGIEYLNKDLIMRTCRADGLLLKPDEPAIFHDAAFKLGFDDNKRIELWHTMSNITGVQTHYVLAVDLDESAELTLADLGADPSSKFIAYDYFASCPLEADTCDFKSLVHVDSTHPLTLKATKQEVSASGAVTFQYWVLAETLPNGWTALAEGEKFVPASRQRFDSISGGEGQPFKAEVSGAPNEPLNLYAVFPSGEVGTTTPTLPASGKGTISCTGHGSSDVKCTMS